MIEGRCSVGIATVLPMRPPALASEPVGEVTLVRVASKHHPLASFRGKIPASELANHVQLVRTDRSGITGSHNFGVMSPLTWRLADLFAKHAFLVDGIGWGGMPLHAVERELADGTLVLLDMQDASEGTVKLQVSAFYSHEAPPGPAGRWFIERMKHRTG